MFWGDVSLPNIFLVPGPPGRRQGTSPRRGRTSIITHKSNPVEASPTCIGQQGRIKEKAQTWPSCALNFPGTSGSSLEHRRGMLLIYFPRNHTPCLVPFCGKGLKWACVLGPYLSPSSPLSAQTHSFNPKSVL